MTDDEIRRYLGDIADPTKYDQSTWPPQRIYQTPKLRYDGTRGAGYAAIEFDGVTRDPLWIDAPDDVIQILVAAWNLIRDEEDGNVDRVRERLRDEEVMRRT